MSAYLLDAFRHIFHVLRAGYQAYAPGHLLFICSSVAPSEPIDGFETPSIRFTLAFHIAIRGNEAFSVNVLVSLISVNPGAA